MNKNDARTTGLKQRSLLTGQQRSQYSHQIFLQTIPYLHKANIVGCYISMRDEVMTDEIVHHCFTMQIPLAVPKTEKDGLHFYFIHSLNDLKPGVFGVQEPWQTEEVDLTDIDIMLVPLSSFDSSLHRTGYGKGYYDHILLDSMSKIGLGYSCQQVEKIETDPWDVTLDLIITENFDNKFGK